MVLLAQKDAGAAKTLAFELGRKADGVFLWVTLVTKQLLKGLRNGDSISDLDSRLNGYAS
jgi:hypothetical protein